MRFTGSPEINSLVDELLDITADEMDTGAPAGFTRTLPALRQTQAVRQVPAARSSVPAARVPAARVPAGRSGGFVPEMSGMYSDSEINDMMDRVSAAASRVQAAEKQIRKREIAETINQRVEDAVTSMIGSTLGGPVSGQGGPGMGLRSLSENAQFRTMLPLQRVFAGAGSDTLEIEPQLAFRGESLIIDETTGASLTINDVKVGNSSQLIATGSMSGLLFSPLATRSWLHTQWCGPSKKFEIGVTWAGAAGTVRVAASGVASLIDVNPGFGGLARS